MKKNTSWQNVSGWYNKIVDIKGHYYHKNVIIPGSLRLLDLDQQSSVLDFASGQGILARSIPGNIYYLGVDISFSLIGSAKKLDKNPLHRYITSDVTKPLSVEKKDFSHAVIILSLQNIEDPQAVFRNASKHLKNFGKFLIVINHPCFRIPRQSSWEIDKENRIEYRRINRYLSPLKIPVNMHPGEKNSSVTWSFHYSVSDYSRFLSNAGFIIEKIEEWTSDKISVGRAAKMENRSRMEFPLFMAILARKESR